MIASRVTRYNFDCNLKIEDALTLIPLRMLNVGVFSASTAAIIIGYVYT